MDGQDAAEGLITRLSRRKLTLLLDNCEHLIGSSSQLARALLSGCPGVGVLATSREALSVAGEVVVPVAGLSLPEPARAGDQGWLEESEAATLFVERARAGAGRFFN